MNLSSDLVARFGATDMPVRAFFCPGRVNLIGEHIDYNGGNVFPAAVTMGIGAAARLRSDGRFRVYSANMDAEATFEVNANDKKDPSIGWANYVKGVLVFLKAAGHEVPGLDIYYQGDLPDGAGLSSSAAIEVLTGYLALCLAGKPDAQIDRIWLAQFCQAVENQFIGVNCGIMDQFSVANAQAGKAILLDCQTIRGRQVPLDLDGHILLILNTNKERQLAESKYNERRAECEQALALINRQHAYPDLCSATMADVDDFVVNPTLHRRARHVVSEQTRVMTAVQVLEAGDLAAFGKLLNESHHSLKEDYEVTGQHLDALVAAAQAQPGCLGARMTGAGFGGCAIALVKKDTLPAFKKAVAAAYKAATGMDPDFYESQAGEGVREL